MADPEDPPHTEASNTPTDLPRLRGRFFTLTKNTRRGILHGSVIAIILFLIFFGYFYVELVLVPRGRDWYYMHRGSDAYYRRGGDWNSVHRGSDTYYRRAKRVSGAIQIVSFLVISCLYIWALSRPTEKITSGPLLRVLAAIAVDFMLISISARGIQTTTMFVVNTVAISSYCISQLYPVAEPWLQYFILKLYPIAQPWIQHLPWNSTILLLHGSIITILLFHTICALEYDNLGMQIVAYPTIACLHLWASLGRTEIIVSGAFLGALALMVVFVSIGAHALDIVIVFMANIVALSSYCIWKLYLVAKPWLPYCFRKLYPIAQPWLQHLPPLAPAWQEDEQTGLLFQQQTMFRIQDLPRQFSPGEVRAMTQDFQSMVGQGGFAQVFRGLLDDGTTVAVKRITTTGAGEDDFLREISIVANVHHRSLVRLLGYCLQRGGNRYLVYPFFENGSLDSWLFHGTEKRRLLPWPMRRCIAVDVAKALAYLHHECHQQILHLDIKPGNILLDGDLRAHVSDFGISMSITRDLSNVDTHGRGTPGYMAPEMMINAVSAKSDVFSYGMTLLELVGGRRNFEPSSSEDSSATPDLMRDFFPYIVREKMEGGELMEVVDAAMVLVDREEVEAVVKVALSCIQSRWDMRPSMLTVVDMLEGRVAADLPSGSRHLSSVNFSDLLSSSLTHGR